MTASHVSFSAFVLFAGGFFTLFSYFNLVSKASIFAAHGAPESEKRGIEAAPLCLAIVFACWLGFVISYTTNYPLKFKVILPSAILPIILGFLTTFLPSVKKILLALHLHQMIQLQTYRILGFLFIFPYFTSGLLTQDFALNAGIGDIITGIFAIPVAKLMQKDRDKYSWCFVAWSIFGIADLIVAPASAAYFGFENSAFEGKVGFPISTIPMFFGPPFGILIHLITWRCFYLSKKSKVN